MGTAVANPTEASAQPQAAEQEQPRVSKTGMDLDTFKDVRLYKKVERIGEVSTVQDALERLNGDHNKLLKILRQGLQEEAKKTAYTSNEGWLIEDEGEETEQPFTGKLVPADVVNEKVLGMAKVAFNFNEAKNADEKRAAKEAAKEFIRNTPKILESLKAAAAARMAAPASQG